MEICATPENKDSVCSRDAATASLHKAIAEKGQSMAHTVHEATLGPGLAEAGRLSWARLAAVPGALNGSRSN
jgi:hypothetical protein